MYLRIKVNLVAEFPLHQGSPGMHQGSPGDTLVAESESAQEATLHSEPNGLEEVYKTT